MNGIRSSVTKTVSFFHPCPLSRPLGLTITVFPGLPHLNLWQSGHNNLEASGFF